MNEYIGLHVVHTWSWYFGKDFIKRTYEVEEVRPVVLGQEHDYFLHLISSDRRDRRVIRLSDVGKSNELKEGRVDCWDWTSTNFLTKDLLFALSFFIIGIIALALFLNY